MICLSNMWYDLSKVFDRERFKVRCNALFKSGKTVELTEKKMLRSIRQNSYLHLILSWFAIETGNKMEFVKQEYFKKLCNADIFLTYVDDPYLGHIAILRSSSDLDSAEMTTAIERFRNWASMEAGIRLPDPNEEEFLHTIRIEIERNKKFL